jgi:hypothetical protein
MMQDLLCKTEKKRMTDNINDHWPKALTSYRINDNLLTYVLLGILSVQSRKKTIQKIFHEVKPLRKISIGKG